MEKKYSWVKIILFTFIINSFIIIGVEALARGGAYVYYGFNPYYLFYGTQSWKTNDGHSKKFKGYFKFPSDRKFVFGTPEPARINNHGFRGEDFSAKKHANTFRIITMGASSTFGYRNRDTGTYPQQLQNLFKSRDPKLNIEVINSGIPHLNSNNILNMLQYELLDYNPDLLTLYTGYNDAAFPVDESIIQRLQRWLDTYSAAYAAIRKLGLLINLRLHNRWQQYSPQMQRIDVERQLSHNVNRYKRNLLFMIELARKRNIQLVLIKQIVTTPAGLQDRSRSQKYKEEFKAISNKLNHAGEISGDEVVMYVHYHLMNVLEDLASAYQIPLIDNVKLVNQRPEGLLTLVHLSEEANSRLAEELYNTVKEIVLTRNALNITKKELQ